MLVRTQENSRQRSSSSESNELAGYAVSCSEFKYQRGTEIFGEAEPARYLYQSRAGRFEAINRWLTVGGRSWPFICRVTYLALRTVQYTDLLPKQLLKRLFV